ncbi:MAG: hypothetical protein LCI00_17050 [Chloroflexi bacterium]|nr:hypothetical protein [Chloroflexota bacterium]
MNHITDTDNMVITPLELVNRLLDNGERDRALEVINEIARSAETDSAAGRWLIGDLANIVTTAYGKNSVKTFAIEAGIAYSTARQYKQMSAFYEVDMRYQLKNIGYSHMRAAMALGDDALSFLAEASANGWTVEKCKVEVRERIGKPAPPAKLLEGEACVQSVDIGTGRVVLMLTPGLDMGALGNLANQLVNVKFYEKEAA